MAATIDIVIPDLGDFSDVEVIELLVAAGAEVEKEDSLITLETDKAAMDVPAPSNGTVIDITVTIGDKVSAGDVIGHMSVEHDETVMVKPEFDSTSTPEATAEEVPAAAPAPAPAAKRTLEVPDLGDFDDIEVIEVHIAPGSEVQLDDPLVTLETDKAAMDVPATAAGTIVSVAVSVGDKVSKGSAIAVIDALAQSAPVVAEKVSGTPAKTVAPVVTNPAPQKPLAAATPRSLPTINESGFSKAHASPSVRKLARELGVDLVQVKGSGLKSRILHDDVKAFVKAILTGASLVHGGGLPKVPVIDFAKFGEIDAQPLTRIQKISGPRLQASWINLPHVTQHDEADITQLEAKRQELKGPAKENGISLTPLAFVMKACIAALKEFPKVNASLSEDGASLIFKNYYHLGFAADTPNGLMVPVIRDADKLDVYELATALGELSALARLSGKS